MNAKALFISIGIIVLIGLFILAYWLTSPSPTITTPSPSSPNTSSPLSGTVPSTNTPTNVPVGLSANTPSAQSDFATIATVGGGSVQVKDFIKDPTTVLDPHNPGYYYLGYHEYGSVPDTTATTSAPYLITYESTTQYFNIILQQEPIGLARQEAEQDLMTRLGISQAQMCQLIYTISVPGYVNTQLSGENFGFSFCPNATKLPQ